MTAFLLVGLGGGLGAMGRYGLGELAQRVPALGAFPYGTLAVNVLGCLAIGCLAGAAETRGAMSPERSAFLLVGVLGGFTTFSAFGLETVSMLREGQPVSACANVGLQVALGLGAVALGFMLARGS